MKRRWLLLGGIIAAALLVVSAPMVASAGKGRGHQKPDRRTARPRRSRAHR